MSTPSDTISDTCAILERDGHLVESTADPRDGDAAASVARSWKRWEVQHEA